MNSFVT